MATLRSTKKDIAYLTGEVISNAYMALYFQGESAEKSLMDVISKAVDMHNSLIERANHPTEKKNRSLVRKHYAALKADMIAGVDTLFGEISNVCAAEK